MVCIKELTKIVSFALFIVVLLCQQVTAQNHFVETKYGTVAISGTPNRVVTLYEGALDAATTVGVKVLGAVNTRGSNGVAEYIQDQVPNIQIVGSPRETNIEAVIALRPDLILAPPKMSKDQYQLLSAVAPTIVPDVQFLEADSWKKESLVYARALSKEDKMRDAILAVDDKIAELRNKLEVIHHVEGARAALIRWVPQGAMLLSNETFTASLLANLGFKLEDAGIIKPNRPHSSPLSQERLSLIDGDWLFIATLDTDARNALAAAKNSPAFSRLQVVTRQRAYPVDGTLWTSAKGPMAAATIMDQLEQLILPKVN